MTDNEHPPEAYQSGEIDIIKKSVEPISALREDVAYIRGKVDIIVDSHEPRINALENTMRATNIMTPVLGAMLAVWAWFTRGSGG